MKYCKLYISLSKYIVVVVVVVNGVQVQKVSQQSDLCQVLEGYSWNLGFDQNKEQDWGNAKCLDMTWDFTGPGEAGFAKILTWDVVLGKI